MCLITYNFLVIVFEAADHEVHVLVDFSAVHSRGIKLAETLQVKDVYISIAVKFMTVELRQESKATLGQRELSEIS